MTNFDIICVLLGLFNVGMGGASLALGVRSMLWLQWLMLVSGVLLLIATAMTLGKPVILLRR